MLDNAVLEYNGDNPVLYYYNNTKNGYNEPEDAGVLRIKGECTVTHTATTGSGNPGLTIRPGATPLAFADLEIMGEDDKSHLTITSNRSNAIYLHGVSESFPNAFKAFAHLTVNTNVTLYAPNGNAVRGRQGGSQNNVPIEVVYVDRKGYLHMPGTYANGTI